MLDNDLMVQLREEDRGLSPDNAPMLNQRFYDAQPWAYFRRRLHLAQTADPDAELVPPGGTMFTVGKAQVRLDPHEGEDREADVSSIANTRFVAAEGEVLLHHTSETVLRLALAHLPAADGALPEAPWLALARERSFKTFKERLHETFLADIDIHARRQSMQLLFDRHPAPAKHGFALRGDRSALDVHVDNHSVMAASGYSVALLHVVGDRSGRRRWRLTERWYSIDVTVALISTATDLLENLWAVARRRYLGAPLPVVFTPPPLSDLLELEDGDPRRLIEMYSTLRYG